MKLFRASLPLALLFGVDKIVGLARQLLVARAYGNTSVMGAYSASNNLPDLVVLLLSGGALSIALIPILSETLNREGKAATWQLFSLVLNFAFLITAVLAILLALFADPLVRYFVVPGFDSATQDITIALMRINLIAMFTFCLSGLVTAGLQANQHFLLPGLAPLLYNVGQIIGVVFLAKQFGIYGLAYGVILGAALHLAIQLPGLVRHQFQWRPTLNWRHPALSQVLRLVGPRILNIGVFYAIFLATDNIASNLSNGPVAVSAINYGWAIMQMPQTILGTTIAIVLLPTLSELMAQGNLAAVKTTLRRALLVLLSLTLPATVAAMLLVQPLVEQVFKGREGISLVVAAALAFLPGITGHSLVEIAVRAFYARRQPFIPLITATLNLGLFIGLCWLLVPLMSHAGIALANTLAFTTQGIGLVWLLKRRDML